MASKWEDLNMDCVVNILGRVDIETLLLGVPYVCKSWYEATCNPHCWTTLNFEKGSTDDFPALLNEKFQTHSGKFSVTGMIKYAARRGNEFTTSVHLPFSCTPEALVFVSNECPNLKALKLPYFVNLHNVIPTLASLASKWKRLESISLTWTCNMREIYEQVSIHCTNLRSLEVIDGSVSKADATSIVNLFPRLISLRLRRLFVQKKNLLTILNGCKKLEYLEVLNCQGCDDCDSDILKFVPRMKILKLQGCRFSSAIEEIVRICCDHLIYGRI